MSFTPPPPSENEPQYKGYYRGPVTPQGDFSKLRALAEGYFGLNNVFLLNVVIAIGLNVLIGSLKKSESVALVFLVALVVLFGLIAGLTYPYNKKIGYGKGWSPSGALVASLLMGLNSALCCGIIGYIVMQSIASSEMKKYGIVGGGFGLKKKAVMERIAQMEEAARQSPPPSSPTPGMQI